MNNANLAAYRNAVRQSISDGAIDTAKVAMLEKLRKALSVSESEHDSIVSELIEGVLPARATPEKATPPGAVSRSIGTPALEEPPVSTPKEFIKAGKEAYRGGDFERAIELCQKALDIDPKNSEAQFFMKRARLKAGKRPPGPHSVSGSADPLFSHTMHTRPGPAPAPTPPSVKEPGKKKVISVSKGTASSGLDFSNAPPPDPNCTSCGGSGECSWCHGTKICWMCKGSGKCPECGGKGMIDGKPCPSCKGSGVCSSCEGEGVCHWCKGSGLCHRCIVSKMLWG